MGQAGPLPQAAASALQVRTRSQAIGVAHEERDSEQDECEVGYSLRVEEAQSRAPIGKRSHKERLTMAETRLDVLEASSEELYQGQRRLLGPQVGLKCKLASKLLEPLMRRGSEQDEREVWYSPRVEEAPSGAPTGKKSHKERLTMTETRFDVLEASLEELYQGQRRLLGVESSQEEAESRIEKVESPID
ncbi:hypothetical protein BHE74_00047406 [Ensete ventricosum]|nr:hypothetical protein BHE74_00047406 [Ensete ventricosum]